MAPRVVVNKCLHSLAYMPAVATGRFLLREYRRAGESHRLSIFWRFQRVQSRSRRFRVLVGFKGCRRVSSDFHRQQLVLGREQTPGAMFCILGVTKKGDVNQTASCHQCMRAVDMM